MTNGRAEPGWMRRLGYGAVVAGVVLAIAGFTTNPASAVDNGNQNPGPPGSNGTVKIDGTDLNDGPGHTQKPNDPLDEGTDNDPHVNCGFELEFFNFDTGQTADITFTAHAPTGTNGVLYDENHLISDDGTAGAPNDVDAVIPFNLDADFDTSQFTSVHPIHGYHVKLNITVYDADGKKVPGAQKHKVFWVEGCETPPPTTTSSTTSTTSSTTSTTSSTTTTTQATTTTTQATTTTTQAQILPTTIVAPTTQAAPVTTAAPTAVLGEVVTRELPRTGTSSTLPLTEVGVVLIGMGLVFLRSSRLRSIRA